MQKQRNDLVTPELLQARIGSGIMGISKWIRFCQFFMERGFEVRLYEATNSVSKYVTLTRKGSSFKVRFSNHMPIERREANRDCDFFVGVTHYGITRARDAAIAAITFFKEKENASTTTTE